MPLFDAPDLLTRFKRQYNRPSVDEAWTDQAVDDVAWQFLSDAQREVNLRIAWLCPDVAYGPPKQLTTTDNGVTYGFGLDADGNPIIPLGQMEIRSGRAGSLLLPGNDWDNTATRYMIDTAATTGYPVIRFPGQKSKLFAGGLWARFVPTLPQITGPASTITLNPFIARELIPIFAAPMGCQRLDVDPNGYEQTKETKWMTFLSAVETQSFGSGVRGLGGGTGAAWWQSSGDLGPMSNG